MHTVDRSSAGLQQIITWPSSLMHEFGTDLFIVMGVRTERKQHLASGVASLRVAWGFQRDHNHRAVV